MILLHRDIVRSLCCECTYLLGLGEYTVGIRVLSLFLLTYIVILDYYMDVLNKQQDISMA